GGEGMRRHAGALRGAEVEEQPEGVLRPFRRAGHLGVPRLAGDGDRRFVRHETPSHVNGSAPDRGSFVRSRPRTASVQWSQSVMLVEFASYITHWLLMLLQWWPALK